tara:strand:+ start:145 stop:1449 length:1305 start_codon:yes stop_codon:yes gene_type:complete
MFGNSKEYQDIKKLYEEKVSKPEQIDEDLKDFISKGGVAGAINRSMQKNEPIKKLRTAVSNIKIGSSTDGNFKVKPFKGLAPKTPIGANTDTSNEIESDANYAKSNAKFNQRFKDANTPTPSNEIESDANYAQSNKAFNRASQGKPPIPRPRVKSPMETGMGDGAARARAMAKARIAAKKAGTYQKPKTAQELARERIARKKAQMNNSFIPNGETIEERLGGKGVSKKAAAGSIYPGEKGDGQTEDQDRGEGNKAKRRAGEKVEKKSPTFMAYIKNKKDDKKDDNKMEAYDLVLDYLLSSQQVATIEEANYVMTEMDAKTIQNIVEDQKKKIDEKFNLGKVRIIPALVKGGLAVGAYKLAFGDKGNNTNTNTNTKTDTSNITVDKVKKKNNNKNNLFKQGLDVIKQAQENPGTGLNPNTRKALELDKDYEEGKR